MVAGRFRMQVQHGCEWGVATWQRLHRQGSQTRRLLVKVECLCLYPLPQWPQHFCSHPRTGGGRSQARPSSACLQRAQKLLCCCHRSSLMTDGRPFIKSETIIHEGQWPTGTLEEEHETDRGGIMWNKVKGKFRGLVS